MKRNGCLLGTSHFELSMFRLELHSRRSAEPFTGPNATHCFLPANQLIISLSPFLPHQNSFELSCQMESIHLRAFDKLKLVVELDFSWNKLNFVPVPQIRQLSLLRRLTMRGNPLYALNETTIAARASGAKQQPETSSPSDGFLRWRSSQAATKNERLPDDELLEGPLFADMNRLFETYPELVRALVDQHTNFQMDHANAIKTANRRDRNGVDRLAATDLKIMQALLQQDDSAGEADSATSLQDVGVDETDLIDNGAQSPADNELDGGANKLNTAPTQIGAYFPHLQELDFGQCKLNYIKWTVLEHFNQLKRLYLDGNQLR